MRAAKTGNGDRDRPVFADERALTFTVVKAVPPKTRASTLGAPFGLRHPTRNNLPTLLAYLLQILVQLLCCNDSYIVHYAPVIAPRSRTKYFAIRVNYFLWGALQTDGAVFRVRKCCVNVRTEPIIRHIGWPPGLWFYSQKSHNKPGGPPFSSACSCHYAGGNVALLLLI
ncbi:MAG: hypothetical protein BECKG1743F_GA0114225_101124 [Candidatus Kentron sp. G]|nr:MAG: hypothetical protein BECKG1743F_GA0114225_101124 [Candidatus Kentron sp. G]